MRQKMMFQHFDIVNGRDYGFLPVPVNWPQSSQERLYDLEEPDGAVTESTALGGRCL